MLSSGLGRYAAPRLATTGVEVREGISFGPQASFTAVVGAEAPDPISHGLANGVLPDSISSLTRLLQEIVPSGGRVLDLGGHVGAFTLSASALGYEVLTVEASPRNAALLQASIERNGFRNTHLVHAAVSDRPGTLEFHSNGPWGHVALPGQTVPTVQVPALAVDDLLAECGWDHVDFIKMDIEGSEVVGLHGLARLLRRPDAPPLFVESNGHTLALFDKTPQQLKAVLEGFGYKNYQVQPDRLRTVRAGEIQAITVVDFLCLKRVPAGLKSWRIDAPLSVAEVAGQVAWSTASASPHERAYIARILAAAGTRLRLHERVVQAVEALRNDADPDVRTAASRIAPVAVWRRWLARMGRTTQQSGAAVPRKDRCKQLVRFVWRKTGPLRQPFVRKLQSFILRAAGPLDGRLETVASSLARIEHTLDLMNLAADRRTEEIHLMFRGLVQEIVRLDEQIKTLIDDGRAPQAHAAHQPDSRANLAA